MIHNIIHTVVNPSRDPTKNPARVMLNALVPFCSRNSIIFCICNGAVYHWTLYLQKSNEISSRQFCNNKIHKQFLTHAHFVFITKCFSTICFNQFYISCNCACVYMCFLFQSIFLFHIYVYKCFLHGSKYVLIMIYNLLRVQIRNKHVYIMRN